MFRSQPAPMRRDRTRAGSPLAEFGEKEVARKMEENILINS